MVGLHVYMATYICTPTIYHGEPNYVFLSYYISQ